MVTLTTKVWPPNARLEFCLAPINDASKIFIETPTRFPREHWIVVIALFWILEENLDHSKSW